MTDLQKMYLAARAGGMRHYEAVRQMAQETGINESSIDECLKRARAADARDARDARRKAARGEAAA